MTTHTFDAAGNARSQNSQPAQWNVLDQLLRQRGAFLDTVDQAPDLSPLVQPLLVAIALGAAVFGATIGGFRGGVQVLFAAVKLPLVVLLTAALCVPVLYGLRLAVGGARPLVRDAALMLGALALGCMVLAALSPVVLLWMLFQGAYHDVVQVTVACCALAGLVGLQLLARGVWRSMPRDRMVALMVLLVTVAAVGSEMSWAFRPYLLRPRAPEPVFMRAPEGGLLDSLTRSHASSQHHYTRDAAPLPEE